MEALKYGKLIKRARVKKQMTQKDLAKSLGVTESAISKWENGRCCPDVTVVADLVEVLDLSIVELLRCLGVSDATLKKYLKEEYLVDEDSINLGTTLSDG